MSGERDFSPSPNCRVCGRESTRGSYLCVICRRLLDRIDTRRDAAGVAWGIDKAARFQVLCEQWDASAAAFRCYYTGVLLNHSYGSRRYATWEHRIPGDKSTVVLVADLVNKMKSDMSEEDFRSMVRELANHFVGKQFHESAFPPDK